MITSTPYYINFHVYISTKITKYALGPKVQGMLDRSTTLKKLPNGRPVLDRTTEM